MYIPAFLYIKLIDTFILKYIYDNSNGWINIYINVCTGKHKYLLI